MRINLVRVVLILFVLGCSRGAYAQKYKDPKISTEERVDDLLSRMTLDEKLSQMGMIKLDQAGEGMEVGVGACESPFIGAEEVVRLSIKAKRFFRDSTRLGIPPIQIAECLHGFLSHGSTVFPQAIAQGSTWNPSLIKEMASVIALEASSAGVDQALSPLFDIIRDPRYGRVEECYGEDAYLVGEIGSAFVCGMQGDPDQTKERIADNKLMCTAKHFAAYSAPVAGINLGPTSIGERELRTSHLPAFQKAVQDANIYSVMPSYNEMDGIAAHESKFLLKQVLRDEWGFQGYVFSDYGAIDMLHSFHKTASDRKDAAMKSVIAGVDLDNTRISYLSLKERVQSGELPEAVIDTCVKRILRVKFKAGLFEKSYPDPKVTKRVIGNKEHKELAQRVAEESVILLKNEASLLPLDRKSLKSIAVLGPNADQVQYGDYSYTKDNASGMTVLQGIKELAGKDISVKYAKGCSISGMSKDGFAEAVDAAKASDVVIFVMGETSSTLSGIGWGDESTNKTEDPNTCGEGFDVTNIDPYGVQRELLQEIYRLGKPIVLVMVHGRPWSITWEKDNIPAILEAWYPGEKGGTAIARILFGEVNPSGRLSVSVPQSVGHIPVFYNHKPSGRGFYHSPGTTDRPGRDYVFASTDPLFSFGFGLSYTTFEYSDMKVSKNNFGAADIVSVSLNVTNTGKREGKEVAQLYFRDIVSSVSVPVKQLIGFEKVLLAPGETKRITFKISPKDLALWDENMQFVTEPGLFEIMVGRSADDILLRENIEYVE